MGIKKDYIKEAVDTMLHIDPSLDREETQAIVTRLFKERMTDPSVHLNNNVTGSSEDTKLTDVCNWLDNKKPVVSGNATFYQQPEELESPTSNMLRSLKRARKSIKKEMFKYKPEDDEYQQLDLAQLNAKVIMNAEYGASGAPTAAFYTKYSPAATTLMAQSIITTMAAFFEGYVGDNQKFFNINECLDWMNRIRQKEDKVHKWIVIPSRTETIDRIKRHFWEFDHLDKNLNRIIEGYIDHCTDDELVYIFYANNMREFIIRHKKIQDILKRILLTLPLYEASEKDVPEAFKDKFTDVNKYNVWVAKEMFLDPYDIPSVIEKEMKELTDLMTQYCFVEYLVPDSIIKLNNHKRNTILLVDTDSNVINADIFVKIVLEDLYPDETFSRSKLYNEMICVNILASMLDKCVIHILDFYGRCHNMGPEARAELTMKNEFLFRRFFLMNTKKRYAASIALREGNIMIPFKIEIKGLDFIKAGVTEEVTTRFTKMLSDNILFSEDINLRGLMKDLNQFEKEIANDVKNGGVRFLKQQTYKSEGAYKSVMKAWSLPIFRAVMIWNEIYPNQKIYSLDRVKIAKLIVTSVEDLDIIKEKYPAEYKTVVDKIFNSSNPDIIKSGLRVLAIPSTIPAIPEWVIPLMDYEVIISDIVGSFRSVLDALKIEAINLNTPNGKANITSSLISI